MVTFQNIQIRCVHFSGCDASKNALRHGDKRQVIQYSLVVGPTKCIATVFLVWPYSVSVTTEVLAWPKRSRLVIGPEKDLNRTQVFLRKCMGLCYSFTLKCLWKENWTNHLDTKCYVRTSCYNTFNVAGGVPFYLMSNS